MRWYWFLLVVTLLLMILVNLNKTNLFQKSCSKVFKLVENREIVSKGDTKIPKNIFQTHYDDMVPESMYEAIESLKRDNPDYSYYFYTDIEARNFIETHFSKRVLECYDSLVPGAYRADLWRYCVLYIKGGVYIDTGFTSVTSLNEVIKTDDTFLSVKDADEKRIYNAFLATTSHHPIIKKVLEIVIERVQNKDYGEMSLYTTGPLALGSAFTEVTKEPVHVGNYGNGIRLLDFYNGVIYEGDKPIFKTKYRCHYHDNELISNKEHYSQLWERREVFRETNGSDHIPKIIFQTCKKKPVDKNIETYTKKMRKMNPTYSYYLFDDEEIDKYIRHNWGPEVIGAYETLKSINVGASLADFWRYLILYQYGGVYIDLDSSTKEPLNSWIDKDDTCILTKEGDDENIYCQFALIFSPRHPFLEETIKEVINNIKDNITSDARLKKSIWHITGPAAFTEGIHKALRKNPDIPYRSFGTQYMNKFHLKHDEVHNIMYRDTEYWEQAEDKKLIK